MRLLYVFYFLLCLTFEGAEKRKTVCLNMIVKDEKTCIEGCLASVKDVIDYYVIVDTGSTDGTQEVIRNFMKGIPGELHERKWVNFAHNRNEALDLARGRADYILFIDADERLVFNGEKKFPPLKKDRYEVIVRQKGQVNGIDNDYHRVCLINEKLDWKWHFVIHEDILCTGPFTMEILGTVMNLSDTTLGARSRDPKKYLKDAAILEEALKTEPRNTRYMFYLAQSYCNAGEHERAIYHFKRRVQAGGCEQEVYHAKLLIGKLQQILGKEPSEFLSSFESACKFRPSRAEGFYCLGLYYNQNKQFSKAYSYLKTASELPLTRDGVFVDRWIYQWGALFELAKCCQQLGKESEMISCMRKIVKSPFAPTEIKVEMERNIRKIQSVETH